MTENGGKAWAQTIFYPFMFASNYGRGTALRTLTESDSYVTSVGRKIPYLATSVIHNDEKKELVVFATNRSLDEDMELNVDAEGFEGCRLVEHVELYADDLMTVNDKDNHHVVPASVAINDDGSILLKKHSWNMLRFQY
jgi:alpha-N-arabinofuranosidase